MPPSSPLAQVTLNIEEVQALLTLLNAGPTVGSPALQSAMLKILLAQRVIQRATS